MRFKAFEELFEIPLRNGLTKPKRVRGEGYKMVNMGELFKYPRINNIPMDRVPLNDKELASSMLLSGDLLFARQSLVLEGAGQCSIFVDDDEEACFESHLIRCRLNKDIANPLFYYYFFSSQIGKQTIGTIVEQGAGASGIRGSDLAKVLVPELDIEVQDAIAFILDQIDSKIELNQQINQTLEQMAQAIFKSWFVDFEPVKAKIAPLETGGSEDDALLAAMQVISGKDPQQLTQLQTENPEHYTTLRTTAELFPAAMQESELGEIPEGWEAGELNDFAMFTSNRISSEGLSHDTYVSTENMLANKAGICSASSLPTTSTVPSFEPKQILVSNIRPYFKKIWFANCSGGRSPDVLGFESKLQGTSEFLYNLIYQDQFFDYMMLTSKGAKMPRGDKNAIMQFKLAIPQVELMLFFSQRVEAFYELININRAESKSLAETRDTLLPKLLSGELSVAAAEEQLIDTVEPAHV